MAKWERNMWISRSIILTTGWLAERSLLLLITTAMWGEGWPPPLLDMRATSAYIQSSRNSGWRSPYTKRSHISLSTIFHFTKEGGDWSSRPWKATSSTKCTNSPWKQRGRHCKACFKISINFSLLQVTRYCYMVPHCKQSLLSIYFYIQFVSGLHERLVVIKNIF